MHDPYKPSSLPPRFDPALAAVAMLGYGGLVVFLATQLDPKLRVSGDARFQVVLWCIEMAAPAAVCWYLRPRLIHFAYAMRLGRAAAHLPDAPPLQDVPSIATRRCIWCCCGTVGTIAWTLAAGIDAGTFSGLLDVHGSGLMLSTLLLCNLGAVGQCVRILSPSLAAVDEVYQLARRHGQGPSGGDVLPLKRPS